MRVGARRVFIVAAASVAAGAVVRAVTPRAPSPAKVHRLGVLGNDENNVWQGLRDGLRERGYREGVDLHVDWRWSRGEPERLPALARELVAFAPQVIVVSGTQAALAARDATSSIPIVMAISLRPERLGLVQSLARPGGNVTGLSTFAPELNAKKLELLKDIVPGVTRVAVLRNAASPAEALQVEDVPTVARAFGMTARFLDVGSIERLQPALADVRDAGDEAMMVIGNPVTFNRRDEIASFALAHRLPTVFEQRLFVEAGGLVSYGPNFTELFRRAAYYVDRILRGAKPADLPVEQPMRFELMLNRATAVALGIALPPAVILRADTVLG